MAKQRYLDLEGLKLNNQLMETEMAEADAKVLEDAKTYADGKDEAIAEAKKAGTDAQTDVDALEEKIGEVPEDKTVVQMIADAQTAATYDDTEVRERIQDNADAIEAHKTDIDAKVTTLVGDDVNKSVRTIANEELAAQLLSGEADADFQTLQELAQWLENHPEDVATINLNIANLQKLIGTLPEGATATDVVGYIAEAVTVEKTRAEGVESGLNTRLEAVEQAVGDGGAVGEQIDAKIAELDANIMSAKVEVGEGLRIGATQVDGKITSLAVYGTFENTYDAKGSAEQAKTDAVATASEDATTKANAAETNAKAYADGLAVNYDAAGSASAAQTNAQNYTDGKVAETNENVEANATAITALEEKVGDGYEAITPEEIQGLFTTTA